MVVDCMHFTYVAYFSVSRSHGAQENSDGRLGGELLLLAEFRVLLKDAGNSQHFEVVLLKLDR